MCSTQEDIVSLETRPSYYLSFGSYLHQQAHCPERRTRQTGHKRAAEKGRVQGSGVGTENGRTRGNFNPIVCLFPTAAVVYYVHRVVRDKRITRTTNRSRVRCTERRKTDYYWLLLILFYFTDTQTYRSTRRKTWKKILPLFNCFWIEINRKFVFNNKILCLRPRIEIVHLGFHRLSFPIDSLKHRKVVRNICGLDILKTVL